MKRLKVILPLLSFLIFMAGCYHAKVTTGKQPSAQVIENNFAASWIYGLVPPKTVKAAEECTNGVSMVETKLSFVNMLVGNLTFGIFTPMSIKVTCAAGMSSADMPGSLDHKITVPRNSTDKDITGAFINAADKAVELQKPVYVTFD